MKGSLYKWGLFLYLDSMRILNAVIAHKDFYWNDLPEEELSKYLVFTYNDIKTNIPNVVKLERVDNLCDNFYSEMAPMKYIRHNVDFDWIVINHYRRRLEVPNFNNIYVPIPNNFVLNVKEMYALNHNIEDLALVTDILMNSDLSPNYKSEWIKSLNDNYMFCYNMFSAPKEVFCELIDNYEKIMYKFIKARNLKTMEDVIKYCDKMPNKEYNHLPYRIGGFIAERLTNCYIRTLINKYNMFPFTTTPIIPTNVKLIEDGMSI